MHIYELYEKLNEMKEKIITENRQPTNAERQAAYDVINQIEFLEAKNTFGETRQPTRPDVSPVGGFSSPVYTRASLKPYELRQPGDKKDHRSMFGEKPNTYCGWTDRDTNFFQALFSGRMHPGLKRAMTEGVKSDGGFLVPTEFEREIHDIALENQIVMPRAYVRPMTSNEVFVPAMEVGDHTDSLYGGFSAYYKAEASTLTKTQPKVRGIDLQAKKLTGLVRMSNELLADAPGGESKIMQICANGLAWYHDKYFLKGSGGGEPLGILNSNCLIKVDKQTGQDADTIVYQNLTNMMARLYQGSFANSIWVCHQTTIPQLLELSIPVGTGGSHYPVLKESNGQFSMLTRPVVFTEKTEVLSDEGDILLADFSQYIIGLRDGLRMAVSPHVYFESDESVGRLIERHDGQPLWSKPLKLQDGTTVSPFVTLKARA